MPTFPHTRASSSSAAASPACSTAYHLTKLGVTDVVLLEQGRLTCGTTWHAAGLVGQTRATRNATRMSRYGIELYSTLEQETGLATGWKQCGSLNVASTPERLALMKRQMARAKSFGVEFEFVSPRMPATIAPILRTDDLVRRGLDSRRRQGESHRSHAIARQGRADARRADRRRRARSTGVTRHNGRVSGVEWTSGDGVRRDRLRDRRQLRRPVGARIGRSAGVNVPLLLGRALLRRHRADRRRDARRCR